MPDIATALLSFALVGLLLLRRASRKDASAGTDASPNGETAFNERHEARRRIVQGAARLRDLEEAVLRFGEGSDPALSPEEADRKRAEAAELRRALEDECIRRRLPIALVRRSRAATQPSCARTPGID